MRVGRRRRVTRRGNTMASNASQIMTTTHSAPAAAINGPIVISMCQWSPTVPRAPLGTPAAVPGINPKTRDRTVTDSRTDGRYENTAVDRTQATGEPGDPGNLRDKAERAGEGPGPGVAARALSPPPPRS